MKIIESKRIPHERAQRSTTIWRFFSLCSFALRLEPISSMRRHQIIWFLWKWFLFPMFDVFFFRSSPIKKLEHWVCMDGSRSFKHNFNRTMNECLYFQFTTMVNFPYGYLFITFVWVFCGNAQGLYVHYAALKSSIFVKLQKLLYKNAIRKSDNDENV